MINRSSAHFYFLLNIDFYLPIIPIVSRICLVLYHYDTLNNVHIIVHLLILKRYFASRIKIILISAYYHSFPLFQCVNKRHSILRGIFNGNFGKGISHTLHVRIMRARILVSAKYLKDSWKTKLPKSRTP